MMMNKLGGRMPKIVLNAFASLQKKLKKKNIKYSNAVMEIQSDLRTVELLSQMGICKNEVGSILINGRVASLDTIIQDGDRIGLVPTFVAGPDRNLPGLKYFKKR